MFHAISNIKKYKIGVKKIKIRGGGGGVLNFFLEKQFFLISRFMLFSKFKKIETPCPSIRLSITSSLLVKWEVVSPNTGSR